MPYFPDSVYATVFAERQHDPAAPIAPSGGTAPPPPSGFFARVAQVLGRTVAPPPRPGTDRDDLLEYHNPALGVRELRVGR